MTAEQQDVKKERKKKNNPESNIYRPVKMKGVQIARMGKDETIKDAEEN